MRRVDRGRVEKGRGAVTNPAGRVEGTRLEATADGWGSLDEPPRRVETVLAPDVPRHAIARNQSPDVPFDQSVNPYQGCEHGCVYCFARLLDRELGAPGYVCKPINLGANTDPYQPAEREHRTTRELLEVLLAHRHPVTVVTKGALVLRDLDLLADLARLDLVTVFVSLTTLDDELKRVLEPHSCCCACRTNSGSSSSSGSASTIPRARTAC